MRSPYFSERAQSKEDPNSTFPPLVGVRANALNRITKPCGQWNCGHQWGPSNKGAGGGGDYGARGLDAQRASWILSLGSRSSSAERPEQSALPISPSSPPSAPPHLHHFPHSLLIQSFLHIFLPSSQYPPTNPQPVQLSNSPTHPSTPQPTSTLPMGLFTWLPSGKCPFYSIISILCPACARICANPSPGPWLSADSGAEMGHGVLGMREGHWVGAQNRHTCSLWDSRELRRAKIQEVPLKLQGDKGDRGESLGYFPCTVNSNTNPASPVGP